MVGGSTTCLGLVLLLLCNLHKEPLIQTSYQIDVAAHYTGANKSSTLCVRVARISCMSVSFQCVCIEWMKTRVVVSMTCHACTPIRSCLHGAPVCHQSSSVPGELSVYQKMNTATCLCSPLLLENLLTSTAQYTFK